MGAAQAADTTHYGGKDLARSFRQVRGNTIQTAEDIPGDKYGFQASPDTRSIGATLAHIAVSTGFQDYIQRNKVTDLASQEFSSTVEPQESREKSCRGKIFHCARVAERALVTPQRMKPDCPEPPFAHRPYLQ